MSNKEEPVEPDAIIFLLGVLGFCLFIVLSIGSILMYLLG